MGGCGECPQATARPSRERPHVISVLHSPLMVREKVLHSSDEVTYLSLSQGSIFAVVMRMAQ